MLLHIVVIITTIQAVNTMGNNAAAMWKNKYIKIRGQLDALRQEQPPTTSDTYISPP